MIKLTTTQANKITGIYDGIYALDPIEVENNFWVIKSKWGKEYGILKRYLKRLLAQGKITIIDMTKASPERTKIRAAFKKQTRTGKIQYKGKHITREL